MLSHTKNWLAEEKVFVISKLQTQDNTLGEETSSQPKAAVQRQQLYTDHARIVKLGDSEDLSDQVFSFVCLTLVWFI